MKIGFNKWQCIGRRYRFRKMSFTKSCFLAIFLFTFVTMVLRGNYGDNRNSIMIKSKNNPKPYRNSLEASTRSTLLAETENYSRGLVSDETTWKRRVAGSPTCPQDPPGLGVHILPSPSELNGSFDETTAEPVDVRLRHDARPGGWWQPSHCQTNYHTAVIIPYRDRKDNLRVLLRYLHPMLQRQLLHYRIFVAEQDGNDTYNKGRIMNSAFKIVQSRFPVYDCFVFHDVDMVPEDDRNMYICANQPKHLSPAVDKFNYSMPYKELIGGVLAMTPDVFKSVNGYANVYWGWGGEDDDMYYRIIATRYKIVRPPLEIGRYSMLPHVKRTWISHKKTYELLGRWRFRQKRDGVNSIRYELISIDSMPSYTHILIRIGA